MESHPMNDNSPAITAPNQPVAHAPRAAGRPWHSLDDHSQAVAALAEAFLGSVVDGQWGHLAGLWHDLGKSAPDWQAFIRAAGEAAQEAHVEEAGERRRGPPHSATGAVHSRRALPANIATPLA